MTQTLPARDLPTRGATAIVGDAGNLSFVTGDIEPSSSLPGFILVETEHGSLYLDADMDVTITNDYTLD